MADRAESLVISDSIFRALQSDVIYMDPRGVNVAGLPGPLGGDQKVEAKCDDLLPSPQRSSKPRRQQDRKGRAALTSTASRS